MVQSANTTGGMRLRLVGSLSATARRTAPGRYTVHGPDGFAVEVRRLSKRPRKWMLLGDRRTFPSVRKAVSAAWAQHDIEADHFPEAVQ